VGRKKKLQHFAENLTFDNLFQLRFDQLTTNGFSHKGRWNNYFNNTNPIIVELGCGKGEYTIGLAKANPSNNYIGVDIKGARLWRGLKNAREENLTNVAFIRSRVELIEHYFEKDEVSEIWITFPDPQLVGSRERKRLTNQMFLTRYNNFLKKDGMIHLKTDSQSFFEYTLDVIQANNHLLHQQISDLYEYPGEEVVKSIKTFYELKWLKENIPIKYIRFSLSDDRSA
jgi:tRNA (guanine-N7-)-methyltransferase